MSVTTTFPGIYIQELPSSTHTIAAAPTSVTVFVGYVHPFKPLPPNFNQALEIFSFSDYERLFGGFYQSGISTRMWRLRSTNFSRTAARMHSLWDCSQRCISAAPHRRSPPLCLPRRPPAASVSSP